MRHALVSLVLAASAQAAPPVEGDADLLRLLVAAQETNASRFPSGRMHFRVQDAAAVGTFKAEGTVAWNGPKIRWEYVQRERGFRGVGLRATREEMNTAERIIGPKMEVRRIEIPGGLMSYRPKFENAYVATGTRPGAGYDELLEVCPSQGWYCMDGPYGHSEGTSWSRLLNPERTPETVTKFIVTKKPNELVSILIHFRSGTELRVVLSLRHGGNVVEYEMAPAKESEARDTSLPVFWHQGSYDWVETDKGEWSVKHMECRRSSHGKGGPLLMDYRLDIDTFDPNAKISPSEFTLASLDLAPGTTVEETGRRDRTYRLGGDGKEEPRISDERLDALGEALKNSGFAEPERADE